VKKTVLILLCLVAFQLQSYASHLLGAEITYTHVKDFKYKVYITVYRDCNECKIAGGGGGSNTKDCSEVLLYLNTSDINSCTSKFLKQFSLMRESIDEILPLCPTAVSKCQSDTGLSYGVEAHTFTTVIDFENYKSYQSCGFDMYVQLALRADDIDNLDQSSQGETLYNYSYINPFKTHSSPKFTANPEILLTVNQASRSFITSDDTDDSIAIHFAQPLRGANNEIKYQSGYFVNRPLSVWCNGDNVYCEANPLANPPVGVTLDPHNGYLAFTPVKNNEKATLVFEVEQWRRTSKGPVLLSKVRRDILVEVTSYGQHNNPPQLRGTSIDKKSNELNLCVGENVCFEIEAKDAPFLFPDGSYQASNAVTYSWISQLSGAQIKQVLKSTAPYNKLQVCWTPQAKDAGKTFELDVTVSDDNCPLQATTSVQYVIQVHDKPENRIKITDLWCGSIKLEADSLNQGNQAPISWELNNKQGQTIFTSNKKIDTLEFSKNFNGNLNVTITSDKGCETKVELPIERETADLQETFGSITGKRAYCIGDSVKLFAKSSNNVLLRNVIWRLNDDTISNQSQVTYSAVFSDVKDRIDVTYVGTRGGLKCIDRKTEYITVEQHQDVDFAFIAPTCEGAGTVDIAQTASVPNGVWKGVNHNLIENNGIKINQLGDINVSVEICQEYTTTSITSGCKSRDTFCMWVVPNPNFKLAKTTVCGATGYFNLTNMDHNLFSFGQYDIDWTVDGIPPGPNPLDNPHVIELAGLSFGDHQVNGAFRNEFGCTTIDTGVLSLLEDIDLSVYSNQQGCQGDVTNLDEIFGIDLGGGLWSSSDHGPSVINNTISPSACGNIDLQFTYDQFGCYASRAFEIDIVCRPQINFNIHDTICALNSAYGLIAVPDIGKFVGDDITDNFLSLGQTEKTHSFEYQVVKSVCIFKYPLQTTVVAAPNLVVGSGVMASICEGQSIDFKDINVINGMLIITSTDGATELSGVGNSYKYIPSETEVGQRKTELTFNLIGHGYCPTPDERYKIRINPKAKIHLLDSHFVGCTSFAFKPRSFYDSEVVDWSKTQTEWDFGDVQKVSSKIQPSYNYKQAGTYSVSLHTVSPEGCVYNKTWLNAVNVNSSPRASFVPSPTGQVSIRRSTVDFINSSTSDDSVVYAWVFGTGNASDVSTDKSPSFTFSQDTGTYPVTLTLTTTKGCDDVYVQNINVGPDIRIFVPTAFSPNNKGSEITEEFKVVGVSILSFHMEIFNRWGQQVYESDNIEEEWDGRSGGRFCENGIYGYLIKATSLSGEHYEFIGTINIVR
jgi:gliding motility-associated-like protein